MALDRVQITNIVISAMIWSVHTLDIHHRAAELSRTAEPDPTHNRPPGHLISLEVHDRLDDFNLLDGLR